MFNSQQRFGILLLVALNVGLLFGYRFINFSEEEVFDVSSSEITRLRLALDSLGEVAVEARRPKMYSFNPNFLTDFKAYSLGLSTEAYDRLQAFRANEKWINSAIDFQKVTGISDSLRDEISPLFKFPDWVTNPKPRRSKKSWIASEEKPIKDKIDLNTATEDQLKMVYGIGDGLSKRIVSYRSKLGGFSADVQLYQVWGLSETTVQKIVRMFTVKTPKKIVMFDLNTATASDIATIPGISFELAIKIWEFVKLRDGITSLSQLQKIEGLSANKFKLITLYLFVE